MGMYHCVSSKTHNLGAWYHTSMLTVRYSIVGTVCTLYRDSCWFLFSLFLSWYHQKPGGMGWYGALGTWVFSGISSLGAVLLNLVQYGQA